MDPKTMSRTLGRSGAAFAALLDGVTDEIMRKRPAPGCWTPLEILCHLVDEERDDFGARLKSVLDDPTAEWPPIDPEGWVAERNYAERQPGPVLGEFLVERAATVAWLGSLEADSLDRSYHHPKLGDLSAGDLVAAWTAHDLLHLRQLATTLLDLLGDQAAPYSTRYAMP